MPDWSYHPMFRPLLFSMPPERARDLTLGAMGTLASLPLGSRLIEAIGDMRPPPVLRRNVLGIELSSPVGLGAGLDVHTRALAALARFGFGYIEVGPVTREPVLGEGRIERLRADRAMRYREPLANDGVDRVATRLKQVCPLPVPLAVRLGCQVDAGAEEAARERAYLIKRLAPYTAFFTLDTRYGASVGAWSAHAWCEHLGVVLAAVDAHAPGRPVLICLAPDLDDARVEALISPALANGVAGVVVAGGIRAAHDMSEDTYEVGAPTRLASHRMVSSLRQRWGDRLVIIGSGGIYAPEDALRLLDAGASLVQIESGLVYTGPGLPKRINEAVAYAEHAPAPVPRTVSGIPSAQNAEAVGRPCRTLSGDARLRESTITRLRSLARAGWLWIALLGAAMMAGGMAAWLIGVLWVVLPYDLAFVGLTRAQIVAANPRLLSFMAHDRITLAGTMMSIGMVYMGLAVFGMREGWAWARRAVLISGGFGFAGYFLWLGYGYLDPLHTLVTVLLLPLLVLGMRGRMPALSVRVAPNLRNDQRWKLGLWAQLLFVGLGLGLAIAGLTIATIGVTRVFVPEDLGFLRTTPAALQAINPRLIPLIAHDRAGLGGALVADGLGVLLLALWGFREGAAWVWWTLLGAGMPGFGAALGVHVAIGYLNLWHLAPALLAGVVFVVGLILAFPYLCQSRRGGAGAAGVEVPPQAGGRRHGVSEGGWHRRRW